jgi:hypothetical protein
MGQKRAADTDARSAPMMSNGSVESPKASQAAVERPRAYSYVRFSSPKQAEGFSLQRQRDKAAAYAAAILARAAQCKPARVWSK